MKNLFSGGALALLLLAAAHPALADDAGTVSSVAGPSSVADASGDITVESPLLHPAAGLMNDHMHRGGEAMIGVRFEHRRYSGANVRGSGTISDAAILAAGYTARAKRMDMDMAMIDLMFAPSDTVTLMVMPHYMWHRMTMVGIDPMAGMDMGDDHAGHGALGYGDSHSHDSEGFGDTLVSASYRLAGRPGLRAHATLGVWAPTGSVSKTNADGSFVHYGMQPGSGTWDVEPSLTVAGSAGGIGWGAQAAYRWRTETRNKSGFSFGDKAQASGWISYLIGSDIGATARLEYVHEGAINGHYNAGHHHASPPDRQANYGGDTVSAGVGLNWMLPTGGSRRPQLSGEFAVPVHQDLNGIQVPQDWRLSIGLSQTF